MKVLSLEEKRCVIGGAISVSEAPSDENINKNSVFNCVCKFVNHVSAKNINDVKGYCQCVCTPINNCDASWSMPLTEFVNY